MAGETRQGGSDSEHLALLVVPAFALHASAAFTVYNVPGTNADPHRRLPLFVNRRKVGKRVAIFCFVGSRVRTHTRRLIAEPRQLVRSEPEPETHFRRKKGLSVALKI